MGEKRVAEAAEICAEIKALISERYKDSELDVKVIYVALLVAWFDMGKGLGMTREEQLHLCGVWLRDRG